MNQCNSYIKDTDGLGGYIPHCYGTKERKICQCGGDESKCDFYPEKREKATIKITMNAVEYLREKVRMCKYEGKKENGLCENCPFNITLEKINSCDDVEIKYPEKAVQLVYEWAKTHPELPTWNEWLHNVYDYYKSFNNNHNVVNFLEWLNTPIPKKEAEHFNIPNKKELT